MVRQSDLNLPSPIFMSGSAQLSMDVCNLRVPISCIWQHGSHWHQCGNETEPSPPYLGKAGTERGSKVRIRGLLKCRPSFKRLVHGCGVGPALAAPSAGGFSVAAAHWRLVVLVKLGPGGCWHLIHLCFKLVHQVSRGRLLSISCNKARRRLFVHLPSWYLTSKSLIE